VEIITFQPPQRGRLAEGGHFIPSHYLCSTFLGKCLEFTLNYIFFFVRFRLTYLVPPKVNAASKGEAALTKSLPGAPLYAPALKKTSPATATNASTAFVATDGDASCSKPAKNEPETAAAGQETVTATIDDNGTINATNTIDDAGDSSDGASMLEAMAIAQLKWQVEWLGKELSKGGDAALHAKAALETIVLQETSRLNHSSEVSSSSSSGNDVAAETGAVSSEQGPIGSDKADAAQAIIAEALLLLLHHESSALARARAASVGDVAPADITAEGSLTTDSTSLGNGTTSSNGSGLVSAPNGDAAAAIDAAVAAVVATAERLASMVDSQGKSSREILFFYANLEQLRLLFSCCFLILGLILYFCSYLAVACRLINSLGNTSWPTPPTSSSRRLQ
jgi:hypothetical protein